MRILHLCTDAYGGYGGIALYNRDLIEAFASHPECEEVVVVPRLIHGELEPMPSNVRFLANAARGRLAYMQTLAAAARAGSFDFIVCAHLNLLPLARYVTSKPTLLIYGIDAWKPRRNPITNRLSARVGEVWSISEITRQRFVDWSGYAGPTSIVGNAIHAERYGMRARREELLDRYHIRGKRVILTLGRIVAAERYKGFDEVLGALPSILESDPDVVYLIAGAGNDVPRLQKKAHHLGISDHVVFTGMVREEEKADLYNLADVYVMPSRGEGFGFVFLEALACGVPVVASKHDGGREAIRMGELGRLIDPSSPAEIRTAVLDLLASGRKEVPPGLDYFSFENFEGRVHSLLNSALHR